MVSLNLLIANKIKSIRFKTDWRVVHFREKADVPFLSVRNFKAPMIIPTTETFAITNKGLGKTAPRKSDVSETPSVIALLLFLQSSGTTEWLVACVVLCVVCCVLHPLNTEIQHSITRQCKKNRRFAKVELPQKFMTQGSFERRRRFPSSPWTSLSS